MEVFEETTLSFVLFYNHMWIDYFEVRPELELKLRHFKDLSEIELYGPTKINM